MERAITETEMFSWFTTLDFNQVHWMKIIISIKKKEV